MRRPRILASRAAALVLVALTSPEAQSRGSSSTERPWASEHVEGLPDDIRRDIEGHAKACGNAPAAAHYFSVSIEASGLRFRAQHFEDFACARRSAVCRPEGCLHEVFVDDGRRQRLVFSIYARDLKLTNDGGIAGIEVVDGGGIKTFLWTAGASRHWVMLDEGGRSASAARAQPQEIRECMEAERTARQRRSTPAGWPGPWV